MERLVPDAAFLWMPLLGNVSHIWLASSDGGRWGMTLARGKLKDKEEIGKCSKLLTCNVYKTIRGAL